MGIFFFSLFLFEGNLSGGSVLVSILGFYCYFLIRELAVKLDTTMIDILWLIRGNEASCDFWAC